MIVGKGKKKRKVNIGELTDKRIFRKYVMSSKHFLRKYKAYGISKNIIDDIVVDCDFIEIYDVDTVTKWVVPFKVFMKKSWPWSYGKFEQQLFLEKKWWDIYNKEDIIIQKGKTEKGMIRKEKTSQLDLI